MSQTLLGIVTMILWGVLTIGAVARGFRRLASSHFTGIRLFLLCVAYIAALVLANIVGFFLSFALGYCENCAGKSVGFGDLITVIVLLAPSAIAIFLSSLESS